MTAAHTPEPRAAEPPPTAQRSMADLVRAAVSGWLGTALEFMDFQLYSLAAALVFSQLFFSGESPGMAVVLSMATYGVGYIARPLGAIFFGRLGDRIGRRKVLFYTIALMGAATTLIGVLPTYAQVGMLAPILLVALRLLQGFGAGAEISGAGVMLAEYAPPERRGFLASLVGLGTNCGTLFASAIWAILLGVMVESDVIAWGWRIPFIASAAVMLFAVWVRLNLKESPVFEEREDVVDGRALSRDQIVEQAEHGVDVRTLEAIQRKPVKAVLVSFFLRFGQAGNSGLIQTYLISFMTLTLALQKSLSANVVIVSSLVGFLTIPLVGWLGDRFGRRRMYIIVTSAALVVIVPSDAGHRLQGPGLGVRRLRRAAQRRGAQPGLARKLLDPRDLRRPQPLHPHRRRPRDRRRDRHRNRPGRRRRVGSRRNRKSHPDHGDAGPVHPVGADRRRLGQGLDRPRPDRPATRDVTARKPNCHRERNP